MCGLFGFVGERPTKLFLRAAEEAARRGPHAVGVAWRGVGEGLVTWPQPWEKVQGQIVARVARARVIVGHCRLSTSGEYRSNTSNQPLRVGATVVAHNGNVRHWRELPYGYRTGCDSEAWGWAIEQAQGSLAERVERALGVVDDGGPFALLAWRGAEVVALRRGHPLRWEEAAGVYLSSGKVGQMLDEGRVYVWGAA